MKTLLVTAHPRRDSLTNEVCRVVEQTLKQREFIIEVADLAAERFDPVLDLADEPDWENPRKIYSPQVLEEMTRIERNEASILLFPVYWWSMPAQMKGWIDRVWNHGWAYGDRRFPHKKCWMIGIAGNDRRSFEKRGYDSAMRTQLETGVLDYCGITDRRLELLFGSIEGPECVQKILERAAQIGAEFALPS